VVQQAVGELVGARAYRRVAGWPGWWGRYRLDYFEEDGVSEAEGEGSDGGAEEYVVPEEITLDSEPEA
jgi:hypothetical protein